MVQHNKKNYEQSAYNKAKMAAENSTHYKANEVMPNLEETSIQFASYIFNYWSECNGSNQFNRKLSHVTLTTSKHSLTNSAGSKDKLSPEKRKLAEVCIEDFYPRMVMNGLAPSVEKIQEVCESLYSYTKPPED